MSFLSLFLLLLLLCFELFIILRDVLDHDALHFGFLVRAFGNIHGTGLEEFCTALFSIGMHAFCTMRQFLEIIPIVDDLVAAGPAFLGIMEYRFAGMM